MNKRSLRIGAGLAVLCAAIIAWSLPIGAEPAQTTADRPETIRVACVGDSITYGAGIRDRAKNCYPVQLGQMLGEGWEARNFGVSGATMLKQGDKPYWTQGAFQAALDYRPHAVVIKLGTNDTKPQNWRHKDQFAADCKEMIDRFAQLDSKPQIWICCPVPAYADRWGIRDSVVKDEVIPIVRRVAEEKGIKIIDLYGPLSGKPQLFPDQIHPNQEGAGLMAREIFRALTGKPDAADRKPILQSELPVTTPVPAKR